MKKFFAIVFVIFSTLVLFAQDYSGFTPESSLNNKGYDEKTTRIIVPENQHVTDKTASVKIAYTPMYDEVRIVYTCMYVTYDKGEAMNTVLACLQDFQKENQYYHYTYLTRDREKYFKNERGYSMAQYTSHVKFSR
ncbi:MAG: hypothetical protein IKI31_01765 [Treponema sp.]|nr:hypothetical protein [Treponema sp.]